MRDPWARPNTYLTNFKNKGTNSEVASREYATKDGQVWTYLNGTLITPVTKHPKLHRNRDWIVTNQIGLSEQPR